MPGNPLIGLPDLRREQSTISVVNENPTLYERVERFCRKNSYWLIKLGVFIAYFFVGLTYYGALERWDALEVLYFIVVTVCTVGYGHFYPTNDGVRVFTAFYIIFGVAFVFTSINEYAKFVVNYAHRRAIASMGKRDPLKRQNFFLKRLLAVSWIFAVILLGSAFFSANEDWSFGKAFYFCVVTTFTVGYGDVVVSKDGSLLFNVFYIIISVATVAYTISILTEIEYQQYAEKERFARLERKLDFALLRELDEGDGVDKFTFVIGMLVQLGKLDRHEDVDPWVQRFHKLDADKSGTLNATDIELMEQEEAERLRALEQQVEMVNAKSLPSRGKQALEGVFHLVEGGNCMKHTGVVERTTETEMSDLNSSL